MPQQLASAQYQSFTAYRRHVHKNGLATMPVAGPFPQAAQVVALHGGLDFDAIWYTAVRSGEAPVIPSPYVTNSNRVFLGGERVGMWPIPDVAGITNYAVCGWLLFGILSPEGLASTFYLGSLPFPGIDTNEFIDQSYFKYGLINDTMNTPLAPIPQQPQLVLQTMIQG